MHPPARSSPDGPPLPGDNGVDQEHLLVGILAQRAPEHLPAGIPAPPAPERLLAGILAQQAQELDEAGGIHNPRMEHEPHHAAAADRRAHAVCDPPRATGDHRCLAPGRIGAPDLVLLGDPGRSTPVDRRTLGSDALGDRRVGRRQPGGHRRGRPLLGQRQRLLRRHAPASQVEPHRRQAERLAEPLADQVAHRLVGPQGERPSGGRRSGRKASLGSCRPPRPSRAPCHAAATPADRRARRPGPAHDGAAARC